MTGSILLPCTFAVLSKAQLDCSAFNANSTNSSIVAMSWARRLSACFAANPYDTSQPPLFSTGAIFVNVSYDYSVVYVISLEQGIVSFMGQLLAIWPDVYRPGLMERVSDSYQTNSSYSQRDMETAILIFEYY